MPLKIATRRLLVAATPEHALVVGAGETHGFGATAEAANRDPNEILGEVSDEIRAPMNAILETLGQVVETPLSDGQRHSLERIRLNARAALGVLDDLTDLSRLEAGELELERANFFLRTTVDEALRAPAQQARRNCVKLMHDVGPDVPDALVGDAARLRQILAILVDDAIKLADGRVVVHVAVAGGAQAADSEPCLRFSMSASGQTMREHRGTGLRVVIANHLIALMGGEVTAENEHGRGSTLTFTARLEQQPECRRAVNAVASGFRALVVEEDGDDRNVLDAWLREANVDSTAVADGLAAMDQLWEGVTAGRPYGVVLIDANMRQSDSHALVTRIRARSELAAARIVLMTKGDLARYRDLRIDADLPKPIVRHELLETIRSPTSPTGAVRP